MPHLTAAAEFSEHTKETLEAVIEMYQLACLDQILGPAAYGIAVTQLSRDLGLTMRAACLLFEEVRPGS